MYLLGTSPSDKTVFARADSPWERGILRQVQYSYSHPRTKCPLCFSIAIARVFSSTHPAPLLHNFSPPQTNPVKQDYSGIGEKVRKSYIINV
ncbi:hypothetical protein HY003_03140 [Candidatus Saccharibacteria bacterium]|nr:hypothetical protein [Candidatus Saccharibacteria bacterium]MBI3338270.1 hypothetical protein [Candidatus Saccharibacteria bacterium]